MRRVRRAERCAVIDDGDVIYAAPLPDGPIIVLDGISALIWRVVGDPDVADVTAHVAEATGEHPDDIAPHVATFLDDLVRFGLAVSADD